MSLLYNLIFFIELIIKLIIDPKMFWVSWWNLLSLLIISSSVTSVAFEYETQKTEYQFIKSLMLAIQLFRFCLIFKDIHFLRKFFLLLKRILIKSTPIITLFFLVLFFFSLIGYINNINNSFILLIIL